jgi:hypothetical protein
VVSYEEFMAMGLALPRAQEKITWGTDHTLRVGERMFAVGAPDSGHVSVKAAGVDQAELIAADPETFSVAPYVGRFGWVRVALDRVDAGELRELLTEAWRRTAPKRLVGEFDAAGG